VILDSFTLYLDVREVKEKRIGENKKRELHTLYSSSDISSVLIHI
jgi:hypothetical protein